MILSDRSIRDAIADRRIIIEPLDEDRIQPSSVDLKLDRLFRVFRNHTAGVIDVKENLEDLTELIQIPEDGVFMLHPGEFVLGSTYERVTLGIDLVGRLDGKSSLGRLGLLIHSTAGFIDPGFDGHITLELSNVASLPDHALPGHAHRSDLVPRHDDGRRPSLRQRPARLQVPGSARAHAQPLPRELPASARRAEAMRRRRDLSRGRARSPRT